MEIKKLDLEFVSAYDVEHFMKHFNISFDFSYLLINEIIRGAVYGL